MPPDIDKKIRWMASVDPAVRAAVKAIETSTREILTLYPAPAVAARIMDRQKKAKRSLSLYGEPAAPQFLKRFLSVSTAAGAAVILLMLIFPGLREKTFGTGKAPGRADSLVKGSQYIDLTKTQLLVFRQNNALVEKLTDESEARTGDLLQLAYIAVGDPFGMILSIDGRGRVTLHLPPEREGSTALVQNKRFLLSNAIELDNAPDFERFFLITSASPIEVSAVLTKALDLAADLEKAKHSPLELPRDLEQSSILILKGE